MYIIVNIYIYLYDNICGEGIPADGEWYGSHSIITGSL